MIRIDEIYYNVFVRALQHRTNTALHWFDPFGSVEFNDLCSVPNVPYGQADRRLIFWDQEPLYKETAKRFFDKFCQFDLNPRSVPPHYGFDGKKVVITSELDSTNRQWLEDTYGVSTAHYFFHGWAALDWYRGYNHSFLIKPHEQRQVRYPLFIPNNIIGGQRHHRIHLLAALSKRDSIKNNLISFPETCPYEKISARQLASDMGLDISNVTLPLIIDHGHDHANSSHRIDFWDQAQDCFCQVVTETAWSDRLHITEKTFKPIVMKQPFILVGSRHGLRYLKKYGFKTFNDVWDESYDSLPDDERMEAIADLCATISNWDEGTLQTAQQKLRENIEHNFRWFYGGFQDVLWKELTDMLKEWQ